jgi:hypothetical protein
MKPLPGLGASGSTGGRPRPGRLQIGYLIDQPSSELANQSRRYVIENLGH